MPVEKKLISLVFVALLAGVGGSYGFSYVIYQPQIQNLQNDLNNLNDRLDAMNSTLTNTQSQVSSLQSEISELDERIDELIEVPTNVTKIAEKMHVVIKESETENRTVYLDPNQSYCKVRVFHGGENPVPRDLAYPNASIVFFFLEDIEDPEKADNYSDLVIRMNPIIDEEDGKLKMVIVFFAEGGYDKLVYDQNQLLYHYRDVDPASNYGIRLVEINDP